MSSTKLCRILRAFHYSPDGLRVLHMDVGSAHQIRDDLLPGLIASGFVRLSQDDPSHHKAIGPAAETKDMGAAQENKDMGAAPANKETNKAADGIDAMSRDALVSFLNASGVSFFRGATEDKLRDMARRVSATQTVSVAAE